jgi:CheY-like chemotaxis protein
LVNSILNKIEEEVGNQTRNNLEEIRTEANFILKVVDQCIKAGLLDEAKGHLDKARIIDPTNAYIYAFQERIAFLKEEKEKKNVAVSNRSALENAARAKIEEERKRAEQERAKKEADQQRQREELLQKKREEEKERQEESLHSSGDQTRQQPVSPTKPHPIASAYPETQKMVESVQTKVAASAPTQNRADTIEAHQRDSTSTLETAQTHKTADQAHDMYKRVLMLAWADGAVSQEEQSQLRDLRTTLRITTEEHTKLELEAKEESYSHAFTLVWTSGMSTKERSAVINELRNKYQISPEAHSRIESKVLLEFGEHNDKPMLYVIDDDENTLGMIVRVLEGGGFTVQAYNTSDEALSGLKHDMPDLIISDINLETSTIGGFSFYEKVRQLHHLSLVPFIFLSGMTDEGMVRYGKGLGADDYLTKPFSGDMLVDTVKGKLKRYKQMKHN